MRGYVGPFALRDGYPTQNNNPPTDCLWLACAPVAVPRIT